MSGLTTLQLVLAIAGIVLMLLEAAGVLSGRVNLGWLGAGLVAGALVLVPLLAA